MGFFGHFCMLVKKGKSFGIFRHMKERKKKGFISKLLLQKIVSWVWFGLLGTAE
jgi:hypothetical protein